MGNLLISLMFPVDKFPFLKFREINQIFYNRSQTKFVEFERVAIFRQKKLGKIYSEID